MLGIYLVTRMNETWNGHSKNMAASTTSGSLVIPLVSLLLK